ncbi:hypothetical protein WICANDRAFT_63423 [Wickerhamomyces anomalus NRRL Y-366-8]|uniref:Uncharacterized protein n=1 Tax=Wickerhamomyces anomalus (strain ATCC 58044 / CBS 1984 / NCYC 433 / NRRL Y-366-8) TaxID=683960 RepID=A0A1E3P0D3_WICAA|nr:uncharacterized protein WICANDRAFT_63423 [Wickerhamomyces anomalus NRRL Y-366-8]ODQ58916.1 hypothetical protein WICANDRAFT_63423 [Wickerhamomyces anomalus NRRL Y-366-8]
MSSSAKVYFITGVNRGIGFQIVKQLSEANPENIIIGTARDPTKATELQSLASSNPNIHILKLDVASEESIAALDAQLAPIAKDGIDTFISNAAISDSYHPVLETPKSNWYAHYNTNVIGPIEVSKVLYPYLLKKETRQLIYCSSLVGSLSGFFPISTAAYGQSKAALNHTVLTLSHELKDKGFTVVAVHPGNVSTDMGNYGMDTLSKNHPELGKKLVESYITPEASASYQIHDVFEKLTKESNGKFFNYDGSDYPW